MALYSNDASQASQASQASEATSATTSTNNSSLSSTSSTRRKRPPGGQQLTRDDRLRIQTLQEAGFTLRGIQKVRPEYSYRQICYAVNAPRVTPKKRCGRPRELTDENIDEIEIFVVTSQAGRLMSYLELSLRFCAHWQHLQPSEYQIRRALEARGYHRRVARQKPPLSDKNAQERLAFAEAHKNWSREQWCLILWSDESWVQSGRHRKQWVTRKAGEELNPTCVIIKHQRKRGWMFWGTFYGNKKGPAVVWEKAWGKISSATYCERILPLLEQYLRAHPGLYFMQDNAPSHFARATRQRLLELMITVIKWPAYSPDLNPIEAVWCWMKDWIEDRTGPNANLSYELIRELVQQAWEAVPENLLNELIDSMPARMQAVIDARGYHTKY